MTEIKNPKQYDFEDRTFKFAKRVRAFMKKLQKTLPNIEDAEQPVKSSGSFGVNYIEAHEVLSKKDFMLRIKSCRKESKESRYWLRLVDTGSNAELEHERRDMILEASELTNIFGTTVRKGT